MQRQIRYYADVLEYSEGEEKWTKVGEMTTPRKDLEVSIVDIFDMNMKICKDQSKIRKKRILAESMSNGPIYPSGQNWQNGPIYPPGQNWQNGPTYPFGQNWQNGPIYPSGQNWQNGPRPVYPSGQHWQSGPFWQNGPVYPSRQTWQNGSPNPYTSCHTCHQHQSSPTFTGITWRGPPGLTPNQITVLNDEEDDY